MDDDLLFLKQARHEFAWTPSIDTLRRWISVGLKGRNGERIRLEEKRVGGYVMVSREAIEQFKREVNDKCKKAKVFLTCHLW